MRRNDATEENKKYEGNHVLLFSLGTWRKKAWVNVNNRKDAFNGERCNNYAMEERLPEQYE